MCGASLPEGGEANVRLLRRARRKPARGWWSSLSLCPACKTEARHVGIEAPWYGGYVVVVHQCQAAACVIGLFEEIADDGPAALRKVLANHSAYSPRNPTLSAPRPPVGRAAAARSDVRVLPAYFWTTPELKAMLSGLALLEGDEKWMKAERAAARSARAKVKMLHDRREDPLAKRAKA